MKAQVLAAFGGPENFQLKDVAKPIPEPGKVLVKIAAASINQIDTKIRKGLPIGPELPAVLGADMAGIVEAVGEGVLGFAPGQAVYGCVGGVRGQGGTLAEYILVDACLLARKPKSLSMREAAALPLVAITAWDALERAGLEAGQHVLIHGGIGGVGHVAVQLAKAFGARVATTVADTDAAGIARNLGADETINFLEEKVDAYVQRLTGGEGFPVVFDTIGGDNLARSFAAAGDGGQVVTTNARTTQDLSAMHAKGMSLHVVFMLLPMLTGKGRDRHGRILDDIADLADAGKLRPLVDPRRFTLETVADAHRHLESGAARGKVVVDIDPSLF
jgi:NADPH2:quinone reductase